MSAGFRGRPLEAAIGRQSKTYAREKRIYLRKQETPTAQGPDRSVIYSGTAPIDYLGADATGRAVAVEAKSTHKASLPNDEVRPDQCDALDLMDGLGAVVWLVVAFESAGETYRLDWSAVAPFLANPWRESISRTFCQAYGLLVPEINRDDSQKRRCLFLDAQEHATAAQARVDVILDRERCLARPARPEVSQEALELPPAPSVYVGLSEEQRRQRIIDATQAGIANQLKRAAMTRKWGRR